MQLYKLVCDLSTVAKFFPLWAWVIIGYVLFDRLRKKIAYARLNHNEMKDRGVINDRPIVYMVCGTMGKKKTTTITDMALSQEVMFRDKAFEMILENDLKFPFFPRINLENEIKRAMKMHVIYNLATCRKYVAQKAKNGVSVRSGTVDNFPFVRVITDEQRPESWGLDARALWFLSFYLREKIFDKLRESASARFKIGRFSRKAARCRVTRAVRKDEQIVE